MIGILGISNLMIHLFHIRLLQYLEIRKSKGIVKIQWAQA